MDWIGTGLSHRGLVRRSNEDAFTVKNHVGVWAVADGMGGHAGGAVASQLAVDTITNYLEPRLSHQAPGGLLPADEESLLTESIQVGQQAILRMAECTLELRGMGTTVVLLRIAPRPTPRLRLLHVGDSRAYLLREGSLCRLTADHSLMERYIREGKLSREEAEIHPRRHVLTKALGTGQAKPDLTSLDLALTDQILLCTDGLTTMLSDAHIAEIWRKHVDSSRAACQALVAEANARGGLDNITVIVVSRLTEGGSHEQEVEGLRRTSFHFIDKRDRAV